MINSLLPDREKVNITNDDKRLTLNLSPNKTIKLTKKSFFYTILGLTQFHSGVLEQIGGFIQKIPGTYKKDIPVNVTGIDKIPFKCG